MDENYVPPTKRRRCCVAGCTNRDSKRHRFHKNQPDVFNTWIERIKPYNYENLSLDKIYNSYHVCHEHFPPECMVPGTKRGLKFGAVPSLRIPGFQGKPDHQELSASEPVGIDPVFRSYKMKLLDHLPLYANLLLFQEVRKMRKEKIETIDYIKS
ncbi:uncharacterized protein isoform X2 [Leptinotarsa decemlineata]|uniref:uncharacterized protein isoform X2 n=1 Tax=Leptinotarsa decemlineata TaxID=7539 RepID=UPI003D30A338